MEVKKIVEGMTAVEVAQVIDSNFKNQNNILEEDIDKQNNVIGVSEYKDFSEAEEVNVGDVRKYEGFLYECVEATTGAFDASKWKKSSFKAETEKKLSELGSNTEAKLSELDSDVYGLKNTIQKSDKEKDLYICDGDGNIIAKFDRDGMRDVNIDPASETDKLVVCDKKGNVIAKFDKSGVHGVNVGNSDTAKKDDGNVPSGIMLNFIYGQSLTFIGSFPRGLNLYSMLKFNNQSDYTMSNCTEEILNNEDLLDDYFGDVFVNAVSNDLRGTSAGHANRKCMELLRDENGIDIDIKEGIEPNYQFQLLNIKPSEVNAWYELVDRNGLYYRRLLAAAKYGKKIANSYGLSFSVGSLMYMQGESDADNADSVRQWYDKLWAMFSIINKDVKDITGQQNDILFMPYQMASHSSLNSKSTNLAIGELQLALDDGVANEDYELSYPASSVLKEGDKLIDRKNIQMGAIMVSLDYANDNDHIHATENTYCAAGAQFGVQLKRCIYDQKPIKPIHPLIHKIYNAGNGKYIIDVKFHVPCKPLVIDVSNEECQSQRAKDKNFGLTINKDGVDIIENVKLVGNDSVCILCSQDPTGLVLEYAKDGWETGGNLRDSQDINYVVNYFNYKVHNWCPIFKYSI